MPTLDRGIIVIACGSKDLTPYTFTGYPLGNSNWHALNVYRLRNSGGIAEHLKPSIKQLLETKNINRVVDITHRNCGIMKMAFDMLRGKEEASKSLYDYLAKGFENGPTDLEGIERANPNIQDSFLAQFKRKGQIAQRRVEFLRTEPKVHSDTDTLVIAKMPKVKHPYFASKAGLNLQNTYFLQACTLLEIFPDIEISLRVVRTKDVRVLAYTEADHAEIEDWAERIRRSGMLIGGTNLKMTKLSY